MRRLSENLCQAHHRHHFALNQVPQYHPWPHWLYFCNLDLDNLRTLVCCCMKGVTAIKVDNQPKVGVQCDPLELVHFIARDFMPMNLICERAGMLEARIYLRTKQVFEYFGLPFNALPPPAEKGRA